MLANVFHTCRLHIRRVCTCFEPRVSHLRRGQDAQGRDEPGEAPDAGQPEVPAAALGEDVGPAERGGGIVLREGWGCVDIGEERG